MTDAGFDALVTRLKRLDSGAVSDALDRVGLIGVAPAIHPLFPTDKIAGPVVTVRLTPADGRPSTRHLGTAAVEAVHAGDVIVVDNGGRTAMAGWGGNLALAAKRAGAAGVIVDGAARDVDEVRDNALPLYARGATPVTARGRVVEDAFNVPVYIAGVPVTPGDLVIADASGVVFVPASRAHEVVAVAERIVAREEAIAARIRAGEPVTAVMGGDYEKMLMRDRAS